MGKRRTFPLYVTCQRLGCENVTEVSRPSRQQTQRFCSRRCASIALGNLTHEAMARGGRTRASRARTALIARIGNLSPLEAFRIGYVRGLQSKWRKTKQLKAVLRVEDADDRKMA